MTKGWKAALATLLEGALRERRVVLPAHRVVQRVVRKLGLDQHLAGSLAAPCPAGDLREQAYRRSAARKSLLYSALSAFTTPTRVSCGKIVALGQHLRADQHVDPPGADVLLHGGEGVPAARAVAVHAQQSRAGKQLCQRALDALRAVSGRRQVLVAARSGTRRDGLLVPAVVAAQAPILRCRTSRAEQRVHGLAQPQAGAHQRRRIAAPVHEHQALLAAVQARGDALHQRLGQSVPQAFAARVHAADLRQRRARAGRQRQQRDSAPRSAFA